MMVVVMNKKNYERWMLCWDCGKKINVKARANNLCADCEIKQAQLINKVLKESLAKKNDVL
jgi:NMD protein affecting ribosome stability and mRNA decay